jgi:hypothetical protein
VLVAVRVVPVAVVGSCTTGSGMTGAAAGTLLGASSAMGGSSTSGGMMT